MAKSNDPAYKPDWAEWAAQSRTAIQAGAVSADKAADVDAAAVEAEGENSGDFLLSLEMVSCWKRIARSYVG